MIKCPECGQVLKHKGALNGHLAFKHGIITPKQLSMEELRSEVKGLRAEMDYFHRFFRPIEQLDQTGKHTNCLIAEDAASGNVMRLEAIPEGSWISEEGGLIIKSAEGGLIIKAEEIKDK